MTDGSAKRVSATSVSAAVTRATGHTPPISASAMSSAASALARRSTRMSGAAPLRRRSCLASAGKQRRPFGFGIVGREAAAAAPDRRGRVPKDRARYRRCPRELWPAPDARRRARQAPCPTSCARCSGAIRRPGRGPAAKRAAARRPCARPGKLARTLRLLRLPDAGRRITQSPGRRAAKRAPSAAPGGYLPISARRHADAPPPKRD